MASRDLARSPATLNTLLNDDVDYLFQKPGGRTLAMLSPTEVTVYDVLDDRVLARLPFEVPPRSVAWHPHEPRLLVGADDGGIRVFDTQTWTMITSLPWHPGGITNLACRPDGGLLVSASDGGFVRVTRTAVE